ncbi:MAG: M50 family metallopeptidase [Patescibacteria group bacterium]|nr:M50 family metallopeptidase [Patescibacteria group bacterium]
MRTLIWYLVSVGLLGIVLAIHEAGHFAVHKLVGMPVRGLWVGLPLGDLRLTFRIKSLPVHITPLLFGAGIDVREKIWWKKPYWKRVLILLYGPAFNFIAVFLLCVLFPHLGGLKLGAAAVWAGLTAPWQMVSMFRSGDIAFSDVSGPVGVVEQGVRCLQTDPLLGAFLWFVLLSVSLGGVNLLPLPALDGGQVVVSVLEKWGLPVRWAKALTKMFFVFLLAVLVLLTVKDFVQLVT